MAADAQFSTRLTRTNRGYPLPRNTTTTSSVAPVTTRAAVDPRDEVDVGALVSFASMFGDSSGVGEVVEIQPRVGGELAALVTTEEGQSQEWILVVDCSLLL